MSYSQRFIDFIAKRRDYSIVDGKVISVARDGKIRKLNKRTADRTEEEWWTFFRGQRTKNNAAAKTYRGNLKEEEKNQEKAIEAQSREMVIQEQYHQQQAQYDDNFPNQYFILGAPLPIGVGFLTHPNVGNLVTPNNGFGMQPNYPATFFSGTGLSAQPNDGNYGDSNEDSNEGPQFQPLPNHGVAAFHNAGFDAPQVPNPIDTSDNQLSNEQLLRDVGINFLNVDCYGVNLNAVDHSDNQHQDHQLPNAIDNSGNQPLDLALSAGFDLSAFDNYQPTDTEFAQLCATAEASIPQLPRPSSVPMSRIPTKDSGVADLDSPQQPEPQDKFDNQNDFDSDDLSPLTNQGGMIPAYY